MLKVKVLATVLLALVSLGTTVVPAGAAPTTQTVTILGGVIDEQHSLGSQDPYTETSTDNGATWHPAYLVGSHPWGYVDGTNSWLNCGPTNTDCLMQTSLYRYRFFIPATYSNPTLDAAFIVDNVGVITLNDHEISPGAVRENWSTQGAIDISNMVTAGWNEIRVTLVDEGGLAGINYRLVISMQSVEEVVVAPPGSEPIRVSYNAVGGAVSKLSDLYNIGDPGFNLPIPERPGFVFLGWFTDPDEGTQVTETNYVPASSTTLYAHWAAPEIMQTGLAATGSDQFFILWLAFTLIAGGLVLRLRR